MLSRHLTRRHLAVAAAIAVAALILAASPASAATGPGATAYVGTRVEDPGDVLRRAGNVHIMSLSVDDNPEGVRLDGDVTSWDCEPGQALPECDRVAFNHLIPAGPVSITAAADGSARVTATVAEVRYRDGRQLRVFGVDLAVTAGNLTSRGSCECAWTGADGTRYVQKTFAKGWTGGTASGHIGVYEVVPGASSPAMSSKYWVSSSVPQPV